MTKNFLSGNIGVTPSVAALLTPTLVTPLVRLVALNVLLRVFHLNEI